MNENGALFASFECFRGVCEKQVWGCQKSRDDFKDPSCFVCFGCFVDNFFLKAIDQLLTYQHENDILQVRILQGGLPWTQ